MRFSILAVLGFASVTLAQGEYIEATPGFNVLSKPAFDEVIPAGKATEIEWDPTAEFPETISILLYGGDSRSTLDKVISIASGVDSADGTYSWTVPATLGSHKVYGVRIESETNSTRYQWGNPFTIKAGKGSTTTVTTTSAVTSETSTQAPTSTKASETSKATTETKTTLSTTFTLSNSSAAPTQTVSTTIFEDDVTTTSTATTTSVTVIPSGAAAAIGASSFALLGGVAMAVLAF